MYCSLNINRVIKSIRMRWAGHVARMAGEERIGEEFLDQLKTRYPVKKDRAVWSYVVQQKCDTGLLLLQDVQ